MAASLLLHERLLLSELSPQRRRTGCLGNRLQPCRMLGQVLLAGTDDRRRLAISWQAADFRRAVARPFRRTAAIGCITGQGQAGLPAGHGQVNVGQDLGVKQGAVEFTAGVVDAIALAQGIEAVALARVTLAGHHQGIEDRTVLGDVRTVGLPHQGKFIVDETDVERRVMDDQLGAIDEFEELIGHFGEARLALEEFVSDAVDANRALVTVAVRLQVDVEVAAGQAAPH